MLNNAKSWEAEIGSIRTVVRVTEVDGKPIDVNMTLGPPGNPLSMGVAAICESINIGLRRGLSIASYVKGLSAQKFEPCGETHDPLAPTCSSVVDYLAKSLAARYPETF